jgi:hypothetical protein
MKPLITIISFIALTFSLSVFATENVGDTIKGRQLFERHGCKFTESSGLFQRVHGNGWI